MFYLTTHSTHFIYGYMASDIWLRTILIVRKETRCRHIGYSYRLAARDLLYAPSHRQDNTYHSLYYTSCGALAETRNSSMGPLHEGSIRRPTAPWANALPLSYVPLQRSMKHTEETRSGTHGTTAQSWIMYVDYIHDFHNLECAIHTNDIDLFLHGLTPIINLFFATNHINYSRWLSQFQLDLFNIDSTHSGLHDILSQGTFTVCRTSKSFNRSSVDLALEQTVNADEASRLTGISAATNNYSTPLHWMVTKSSRAVVVSITQDMAGLFGSYDPIAEMRSSQIKRVSSDVQKVLDQIKESCNPFCSAVSEKLYNSSGKAVSTPVQTCLLAIRDKGKLRHDQFIEDCLTDANNFEKSIKKEKLETFKLECKSNKRHPDKKVAVM